MNGGSPETHYKKFYKNGSQNSFVKSQQSIPPSEQMDVVIECAICPSGPFFN